MITLFKIIIGWLVISMTNYFRIIPDAKRDDSGTFVDGQYYEVTYCEIRWLNIIIQWKIMRKEKDEK